VEILAWLYVDIVCISASEAANMDGIEATTKIMIFAIWNTA